MARKNKKNQNYWAQRAKQTHDAIMQRVESEYAARAAELFEEAKRAAEKEIRAWYQRLAKNNQIDYAEAQKLLDKNELKEFHWDAKEYAKHGMDNIDGKWAKELENASAKVHVRRLEALEFRLQALAEEAMGKTKRIMGEAAEFTFSESYYRTAFDLQQRIGVGVFVPGADKHKLNVILNRPWADDEKTYTARCWEQKEGLVNKVNRELFRMTATGEKPDRAIAAIAKDFETTERNAARVILTENAYVASQARHECFTELGVKEYQISGTFDAKMCEYCASMDRKVFKESERREGTNAPPFHPNCRCSDAPYDEDLQGIGERWMRDPETGKGGYVPSDMTYKEWKEIYVDKTSTMEEWTAKHVDKSAESGRIGTGLPVNIQLFAKKSSDFKTVRLPKNEYAHVMREIGTNITEKQRSMNTFSKPIGNYVYTVENKGFGDYRVIRKRRIK